VPRRRGPAGRTSRTTSGPGVEGVPRSTIVSRFLSRLIRGAVLDDSCQVWQELVGLESMERVQGLALQHEMGLVVLSLVLSGLKTLCGMERRQALPALLCRDEALMQWMGFKAQQVRHEGYLRRAANRQRARMAGLMCPATMANTWGRGICETGRSGAVVASGPWPTQGSLVPR
jgi:hypothetical protein